MGKPKVYVATTEQVWAIHDSVPDHLRVAVLLGAFVGLRVAEVAALRVSDVDFIRGVVVHPSGSGPTNRSRPPAAISQYRFRGDLGLLLAASVQKYPSDMMVTNGAGTERCGP
jgi:integrase